MKRWELICNIAHNAMVCRKSFFRQAGSVCVCENLRIAATC